MYILTFLLIGFRFFLIHFIFDDCYILYYQIEFEFLTKSVLNTFHYSFLLNTNFFLVFQPFLKALTRTKPCSSIARFEPTAALISTKQYINFTLRSPLHHHGSKTIHFFYIIFKLKLLSCT